jgi:hypothetical protein
VGWDEARAQTANALVSMHARRVATHATNTTFELALLEGIVALDSAQPDAFALGAGSSVQHTDDGNVRPGQLQQLEAMRATFFGDGASGRKGLLDMMREMPDPSEPSEQP